jgi:glycosyltransferase involved in cell wall biosynthesis
MVNKPMVDVLMMAYNHEKFIAQAIEGVLMQKTNFPFRLIIGEDLSTDATRKICQNYANSYPEIIHLVTRTENIGPYKNFVEIYNLCEAPYIALCEGDDYWTSNEKLQKQVEFLEANDKCIITFHAVEELKQDGSKVISNQNQKTISNIYDLINGWFMNTASYMFKNTKRIQFPNWFYNVKATDLCFHILIAEDGGDIHFIDEVMAVYRRHEGGITNEKSDYIYHLRKNIPFYNEMIAYFKTSNVAYINAAEQKLFDIQNRLFYQLRYKKNKNAQDFIEICKLGFHVKVLRFFK